QDGGTEHGHHVLQADAGGLEPVEPCVRGHHGARADRLAVAVDGPAEAVCGAHGCPPCGPAGAVGAPQRCRTPTESYRAGTVSRPSALEGPSQSTRSIAATRPASASAEVCAKNASSCRLDASKARRMAASEAASTRSATSWTVAI